VQKIIRPTDGFAIKFLFDIVILGAKKELDVLNELILFDKLIVSAALSFVSIAKATFKSDIEATPVPPDFTGNTPATFAASTPLA
jgi:hypothetical protein